MGRRRPRPPPPRRRITMRRKRRRSTMRRRNKCHDVPTTFDLQNIYQTKYILDENKSLHSHSLVSSQHPAHDTTPPPSPSQDHCPLTRCLRVLYLVISMSAPGLSICINILRVCSVTK